ncbi:MAG: lipid-A-disaccharide synthase, partial [Candidatus Sericytochromatia bacterium]
MAGPTIFLSAGEVSGDMHGAHLARALRAARPDLRLVGVGGPRMAAAGVELLADVTRHSAVGLTEQLPHVRPVLKAFKTAKEAIASEPPAAVVLIDYQGANMDLARHAKRLGVPTAYYILPQEWLWGFKGGLKKVAAAADRLIAVFEAEAAAYREAGGSVSYVGHPLLDILAEVRPLALAGQGPLVALLPGSRPQEIDRLVPVFLGAAAIVREAVPEARFVLPIAGAHLAPAVEAAVAKSGLSVTVLEGRGQEALAAADLAIAASGTVTLESAILGVPCVAAYRVSGLTAFLAKRLLRVPYVTLPNIVLGREVVPELLQERATPGTIAEAAIAALRSPDREGLAAVRARLGERGAIARAAEAILAVAALSAEPQPLSPLP